MNKKFVAAAVAILTSLSVTTFAQTEKTAATCADAKTCENKQCGKKPKAPCPFDNLNLTDAQKDQLKALRQDVKKDIKKDAKKVRDDRKNARAEYLAKVKGILTPEQYVQFLENSYLEKGAPRPGGKKDFKGKQGKQPGKMQGKAQGKRPEGK